MRRFCGDQHTSMEGIDLGTPWRRDLEQRYSLMHNAIHKGRTLLTTNYLYQFKNNQAGVYSRNGMTQWGAGKTGPGGIEQETLERSSQGSWKKERSGKDQGKKNKWTKNYFFCVLSPSLWSFGVFLSHLHPLWSFLISAFRLFSKPLICLIPWHMQNTMILPSLLLAALQPAKHWFKCAVRSPSIFSCDRGSKVKWVTEPTPSTKVFDFDA